MAAQPLPELSFLRECFGYDPDTGVLTWRHRPDDHFPSAAVAEMWRKQKAGKPAGWVKKSGCNRYVRIDMHKDGRYLRLQAHRVIWKLMTGRDPADQIDHRDLNGLNNRWLNLREATGSENSANMASRSKRGMPKGVVERHGRYRAAMGKNGKQIVIGVFDTPEQAHAAYCAEAKRLHGEFFNGDGSIFA